MISDWFHQISDVRFPGYNRNRSLIGLDPESYLINGKGRCFDFSINKQTNTPLAEFEITPNKKFRFRIITSTSTICSLRFTIENHPMLLISADGYPVQPQLVRTLYLSSADIYDFVIDANQPPAAYWIRVQGYGPRCTSAYQNAILRYRGSDVQQPLTSSTPELFDVMKKLLELNNGVKPCHLNEGNLCLDEIQSLQKAPERLLKENPDQRFIFTAGTYPFTDEELYDQNTYLRHYLPVSGPGVESYSGMYCDLINKISNMPTSFPLLSDPTNPLIDEMRCREEKCHAVRCECLNLIKLGYNNVVEMVFVDTLQDVLNHPFHIHGHHWSILKFGSTKELESNRFVYKINSTNDHPLIRDSVPIPAQGFVVVRFIADNPGFWLLHCHFVPHNDFSMQLVVQVGEPQQFPQIPKNWPQCGDYLPSV